MRFNTFSNRLILTAVFSIPSYSFLFLIRGYDFSEMTMYAHAQYSGCVFLIVISLFEVHTIKSKILEKIFPLRKEFRKRLITEIVLTAIFTPVIVTFFLYLLYIVLWKMTFLIPLLIEYNIFALTFSLLIVFFVNAEVIFLEWKASLLRNELLEKENLKARYSTLQAQV